MLSFPVSKSVEILDRQDTIGRDVHGEAKGEGCWPRGFLVAFRVYKELSRIRGDIDRLQGRVNYLKQMTAMSTINVELTPDRLSQPLLESSWRPLAIATAAGRSLVSALKWLGTILIWLIVFGVPLTVVLAVLGLVGKRLWEPIARWRRREAQTSTPSSS
jgi:Domain of unknown function (DUF4349)